MSSSALAIATTVHLSMFVVRRHRSRPSGAGIIILLPAIALGGFVWIYPQTAWVAAGLGLHLAWFFYCENQFPAPQFRTAAAPTAAPPRPTHSAPAPSPRRDAGENGGGKPQPFVTVPVLAVLEETPDVKTFRLQRPDGFDFTPGQFLPVRVQVEGRTVQRAYSISSAPQVRGYIEISVKRIGLVSGLLHSNLRPGSLVTVRRPAGAFTYPAGDERPLLLLAGGIGITPLMSMLRHAVATEPTRPVIVIYSVRTPADLAFRDELAVIARRHAQVRLGVAVTQGPPSDRWHHGRITAALVRAYVTDPGHVLAFICGPQPMIDGMKGLLAELGVPKPQVKSESFGAAMALVESPPPDAASRSAVTVRFTRSGRVVPVEPTVTLLEAAERNGVDLPSICRAGSCQTCRTRLVRGEVDCQAPALSDEDRAAGYILPCVSHATSDCELEA